VTGTTDSIDFPTKDAFQGAEQGSVNPRTSPNAFVTKFNASGKLVYSTYLGGSGVCRADNCELLLGDYGMGIAIDNAGNAM
jgi:hypothetical protein